MSEPNCIFDAASAKTREDLYECLEREITTEITDDIDEIPFGYGDSFDGDTGLPLDLPEDGEESETPGQEKILRVIV